MRKLEGIVVSDKMHKTCVVAVEHLRKHKRYVKYYKVTKRLQAHDEDNTYHVGDRVIVEETRPISRTKRWKVVGLVKSKSK